MRKLIALDMDGTLLTTQKEISVENRQAIKDAQSAGHIVMICSGRPHDSLISYLKKEGLGDLPISASNGAITLVEGDIIHRVKMDLSIVNQLFVWLDEKEYPFNLYTNQGIFGPPTFLERAEKGLKAAPPRENTHFVNLGLIAEYLDKVAAISFESWDELPTDLEVFKFYVFTPEPDKKMAFETFAHGLRNLTVTSSYADNVEISDVAGHKGTGIIAVANHFNIPIENTVAIGDNFNDLGMLEVAGFSVAMGNAEEEIKQIADVVTLTNDESGVAHAIKEYIL